MKRLIAGRLALFVARGALIAFELAMRAIAGGLDASVPKHGGRGSRRVRTAAGTVEPVAFDEYGRRVGATTGSPAVKDM